MNAIPGVVEDEIGVQRESTQADEDKGALSESVVS